MLGREGADARMSGMFYITVVQVVLLYGLESWVFSLGIGKVLGGFPHWVKRWLTGRISQCKGEEMWT